MRIAGSWSALGSSVWAIGMVIALAVQPAAAFKLDQLFVPKAELWARWTAHDLEASAAIDHGAWEHFLERYVQRDESGVNRIAYRRVSAADKQALGRYLARLAATPISLFNRDEQLAFWINLYNALTVKLVLDHAAVKSIRDISPGLLSVGPWGRKLVRVEDATLSLNDIEHRILRPIWRDPRIHYAVSCASVGCPNLMRTAFTGENADELLDRGARDYVNNPRGARIEGGKLIVSSIYRWYRKDFGGSDAGVIEHLKRYAERELAAGLGALDRIDDDAYDWGLNDGP